LDSDNWTEGDPYNSEETYTNDGNGYVVWWNNQVPYGWIMSTAVGSLDGGNYWINTGNAFDPEGTFTPVGTNVGNVGFTINCPE